MKTKIKRKTLIQLLKDVFVPPVITDVSNDFSEAPITEPKPSRRKVDRSGLISTPVEGGGQTLTLGRQSREGRQRNRRTKQILEDAKSLLTKRVYQDIERWQAALVQAERAHLPNRLNLYRLYRQIRDDAQIFSAFQTRINKVVQKEFLLRGADGEIDEENTKKLKKLWFRDFVTYVLDSLADGESVIQLGDVVQGNIQWVTRIPTAYYAPEFKAIKKDPVGMPTPDNLIPYDSQDYFMWVIPVARDRFDLGLLNKLSPWYLGKKGVAGAWPLHAEMFGVPYRVVRTDADTEGKDKIMAEMANLATAAVAVIGEDDIFEFKQAGTGDAHKIYENYINICDAQAAKVILGQTGTTDEKSFSGSADVHERILEAITESDAMLVRSVVQDKLLPRLHMLGVLSTGDLVFEWDETEDLPIMDKVQVLKDLSPYYIFDPKKVEAMLQFEGITLRTGINSESESNNNDVDNGGGGITNYSTLLDLYQNTGADLTNIFTNSHLAIIQSEDAFVKNSFKVRNKDLDVKVVLGENKKTGKLEAQAYKFNAKELSPVMAKKWLSDNNIKFIKFESKIL